MAGPIRTSLSAPAAGHGDGGLQAGGAGGATRRRAVAWGGGGVLAALSAACGGAAPGGETGKPAISGPKEITWSCYQSGEARQKLWDDSFKLAAAATGVKINVVWEPSQNYWDKRQTEAAAGSGGVDIMINQLNWVVPGGLQGMFPDHYALMRRDKLDTKEFYKADLESWAWKGKLWSMPMQSGGGVFLYNKAVFDAKGVKYPHKDWTTDDLLDAARRLTDAGASKWGLQVGQNGIHYQMGSFMYSFGGKLLNEAKDKAIYADDAGSVRGAEFDVDLTTKHRVTPPPEVLANAPTGQSGMELNVVAMEFNGLYRHTSVRQAIGAQNLDFAPPPKGPGGAQRVAVAGNAWSILNASKAKDAAWAALHWTYTKEGQQSPQLEAVSWPPIVAAANSPKWLELFKGTRIGDVSKVWETGGHDLLVLPEGDKAWSTMNTPMNAAIRGEMGTREALQESQRQLNELFAQRPANWK